MKNKITSIALVQETAIMKAQLTCGENEARHQSETVKNEAVVKTQNDAFRRLDRGSIPFAPT